MINITHYIKKDALSYRAYVSKRCFFTKSPRTDWVPPKMMKGPNVAKQRPWKLSQETSPPNLRFFWVELIPINYALLLFRSSYDLQHTYYTYKWNELIKFWASGTEEWLWRWVLLAYSGVAPAGCLLTTLLAQAAQAAGRQGSTRQAAGGDTKPGQCSMF